MSAWLSVIPVISDILDQVIPDPEAREKAKLALLQEEHSALSQQLELAVRIDENQTEVNQQEAAHRTLFVAGWRPFIGWVCGVAFAYHFIVQPFILFALKAQGTIIELPAFNMEELTTILMGLLGLGGLRTIEKIRHIAK